MQKALLEEQVESVATQLPALPANVKESLIKFMPILAIVSLVFGGLALIGLLGLGVFTIFSLSLGITLLLSLLLTVAEVVLMALALPGLFARRRDGWVWLYYAELLSIAASIVRLSILDALISLLWLYVLFQVREMYTESGIA
ncbi:MAG: chromate transporter [Candidatus Thermochlorobacter sp.]